MAPQVELPRVPEVADEADVLHEQLEYLIEHATTNARCECSTCQRYLKVRAALLEIFTEPSRANVQEIGPSLAKAA